jgi:TRAP-type C4-dicarboxylate transport system permease small subunit
MGGTEPREGDTSLQDEVLVGPQLRGLTPKTAWRFVPEFVVVACAGLLPLVVSLNVIARYTGLFRVRWAHDITEILFVWLVFFGGALAVKHGAHVRMDAAANRMRARWPAVGRVWSHVVGLFPIALGVLLLVLGVPLVELSMRRELANLHWPAGYYMSAVPISGALITLYGSALYYRTMVRPRREREGS